MMLEKYLKVVFGLVVIDSLFFTFTYSALRDSSLAPLLLGVRLAVDIIFLVIAWRYIKLTATELILIFIVSLSCCFATLPNLQHSSAYLISRFLNDTSGPLVFILKVSALRSLFRQNINALSIKWLSKALIYLSVVQVLIFIYFSSQTGAYAGITLPINIPAASYIGTFNYLGLAATVLLILLSGKRSFLISVAIVSVFAIVLRGSHRNKLVFLALTAILTTFFVEFGNEKINSTVAVANELFGMVEISHIDFDSEKVRTLLYALTAGRSEEIIAILNEMKPWSWLIGLGPGFTYSFLHIDGIVEGYANSHFSPLSFIYKFGVPFMIIFYSYFVVNIKKILKVPHSHGLIVGYALLIFLLQSFFAFNFFAEPYFAILLAYGMAIVSTTQENRDLVVK